MRYKHLLLTRFNIPFLQGDTHCIEPAWLEHRFLLFEQCCLPSVQAQTCQDFTWLLLWDERTPDAYKKRIERHAQQVPQIQCLWLGYEEDINTLYARLGQQYLPEDGALLTSRLDNDDSLALDYVERVQQIAQEITEDRFISLPYGEQCFIRRPHTYKVYCVRNHFLSKIEFQRPRTVLGIDHTTIAQDEITVIPDKRAAWTENVHEKNICNDYSPLYRYHIQSLEEWGQICRMWVKFQWQRIKRHIVLIHNV